MTVSYTHLELDARISAALDSVDLLGQQEKMPASLSGGMIKRVAVARACLLYTSHEAPPSSSATICCLL